MRNIFFSSLFCFAVLSDICSQHLAAYLDYLERFFVFDRGITTQLEQYKVNSFQVGGNCMVYVDYGDDLKVYHRGEVRTLEHTAPTEYYVTDYLVGYSFYDVLKIFEDGKHKTLSTNVDRYIVEDSLIVFYDQVQKELKVYQNGKVITIEDGLLQWPIIKFFSGDNILAYVTSFDNKFKIYYRGQVHVIDDFVRETVFKAGRDIVAYMNITTYTFVVFYKGDFYELEAFAPKSFQVGDEMMAYVDMNDQFKLFENGELITISTFEPEFYILKDSMLVFSEDGFLKTWCDDEIYTIERYIPDQYRISERTIAYIDVNNRIKAFRRCKPEHISYEMVNSLDMIRNLIIYNVGVNTTKIFYNGKVY